MKRLILFQAGGKHRGGQLFQIGDKVLALQIPQHFVEDQVVDMEDRVGGHEDRLLKITLGLVELVELPEFTGLWWDDHKTIGGEQFSLIGRQVGAVKTSNRSQVNGQAIGRNWLAGGGDRRDLVVSKGGSVDVSLFWGSAWRFRSLCGDSLHRWSARSDRSCGMRGFGEQAGRRRRDLRGRGEWSGAVCEEQRKQE